MFLTDELERGLNKVKEIFFKDSQKAILVFWLQ
jgi:hypothetical protein